MVQRYQVPVTFQMVGLNDLREANQLMGHMGRPSGNVAKATRSTARFGQTAQNVGFQVQDLIVQIQGGTDVSRALSQQLPQMTVGFGAWGAAIGVVAAALPALIVSMRGTTEEAENMEDAFAPLSESIGELGRTMNTFDSSSWVEEFNQASEAQRAFMLETLEFDRVMAERARRQAVSSIGFTPVTQREDVSGVRGITGRRSALARANREAAEAVGLSVDAYRELAPLYERVIASEGADQAAVEALRSGLIEYNATLDANNEKLNEQIDLTWELTRANRSLVEARETERAGAEAQATGGALGALVGPGAGGDGGDFGDLSRRELEVLDEFRQSWDQTTDSVVDSGLEVADMWQTIADAGEQAAIGVARGTQDIDDAVRSMVASVGFQLGEMLAKWAAVQAVTALFGGPAAAPAPNAKGNVIAGGRVQPFAKGGIVDQPTLFPMARGAGLMGEVGPEAIMPLGRNSRGELGVKGGGMNITVNNMAPGVAARPRQTDDGLTLDLVVERVAGDIARGGGPVAQALEGTYGIGRGRGAY